jgi:hypothetical protein
MRQVLMMKAVSLSVGAECTITVLGDVAVNAFTKACIPSISRVFAVTIRNIELRGRGRAVPPLRRLLGQSELSMDSHMN